MRSGIFPAGLRPSLLVAGVLVTVTTAACSHPVRIGTHRLVEVALTEYRIRPNDLVAPAGSLTFQVHNDGRLSHNLVIAYGSAVMAATQAIPPGQTGVISVVLPPGRYTISSSIASDETLGDHGTLLVTR